MTGPSFGPSHIPPLKIFRSRKASLRSCIFRKRLYDNSASTGEVPCTPHKNVQFPSPDHCMEGGRCLLASSHAGTRLPIADLIHGPGRSPSARRLLADPVSSFPKVWFLLLFFCHLFRKHNNPELFKSDDIKTGDTHRGMSPVKIHIMTSYGGIIRIRLKGRSSITSSQPANELPCFYQICNVSMLNHRQIYYSASGEIFKCDFLVHFYPLSFHDQGQRKRPPDSGESHNATQKNR